MHKAYILLIAAGILFCTCNKYPLDANDQRDLVALERVWQYCKAFSLYTDRVPVHENLLQFNDPYEMVESLYDTMHSDWADTLPFDPNLQKFTAGVYSQNYANLLMRSDTRYDEKKNIRTISHSQDQIYFKKLTDSTVYVRIYEFGATAYDALRQYDGAIAGIQNIILDLRRNPGGYVDVCRAIIEQFLPAATPYLMVTYRNTSLKSQTDTGTVINEKWVTQQSGSVWEGKKVALLMNRYSASAAEILIVALRDALGAQSAFIWGEKSYGKAIGQSIFHFVNNAGLKLTSLRFLRITGNDYHEKGIEPDKAFSGTFEDELLEAGNWLEAGFASIVDQTNLNQVIIDNSTVFKPQVVGCFRVIKESDLPFSY